MNRIARRENMDNVDEILAKYELLKSALTPFGNKITHLYATPKSPEPGVLEWYSEIQGQPIAYEALNEKEQSLLKSSLEEIIQSIKSLSSQWHDNEGKAILERVTQSPTPCSLYSLNGTPIITLGEQIITPIAPIVAPRPPFFNRGCLFPGLLLALLLLLFLFFGYFLWDYWQKHGHLPFIETKETQIVALEPKAIDNALTPIKSNLPLILAQVPEPEPETVPEPIPQTPPKVDLAAQEKAKKIALCKKEQKKQATEKAQMVILMDASYSMMLNMNASNQDIERWERNQYIPGIEDEPRRMSIAKKATINVINDLPKHVDIGLVTAYDCNRLDINNTLSYGKRKSLINKINAIKPDGATALAQGLSYAGQQLDPNKESMILVISDGKETCNGDPCAVARALANSHPKLKINVIDILGAGAGTCLAEATKGRVFTAKNANQINTMLKDAADDMRAVECE